MKQKEEIVFRRDLSQEEREKGRQEAKDLHRKSHADKGAFAGFMLSVVLTRLFLGQSTSWLTMGLMGGLGALLGSLLGYVEFLLRKKK